MKTYEIENPTVTQALNSFNDWMNRPAAKVQVYSWRLAVQLEHAGDPACGIRIVPHLRRICGVIDWRNRVAREIRALRALRQYSRHNLPRYIEQTGEYKFNQ